MDPLSYAYTSKLKNIFLKSELDEIPIKRRKSQSKNL